MITVFKNNQFYTISNSLYESIKKDENFLIETTHINDIIFSLIKQNYKIPLNKEQKNIIIDVIDTLTKNGEVNVKKIEKEAAIELGLEKEDVKDEVEQEIVDQQAKDTNGNMSGDVKSNVSPELNTEINQNNEKNSSETHQEKIEKIEREVEKTDNISYDFVFNAEDIQNIEELSKNTNMMIEISRNIVKRCKHVIEMATGLVGGSGTISSNAKLLVGGFKFNTMARMGEQSKLKKYYLGVLQNSNSPYTDTIRKILLVKPNSEIKGLNQDLINKCKQIRNSIYQIGWVLLVNNKSEYNHILRAIRLDDVLNGQFNVNEAGRQQILNSVEDVLTFVAKDKTKDISCIISVRPLASKYQPLINQASDTLNAYKNLKV